MRRVALVTLVALVVGAPRADAFSIGGLIGVGVAQTDTWGGGQHIGVTSPDWNFQLSLGGTPFRPGLLDWNLVLYYRGLRSFYAQSSTAVDNVGGAVNLTLFSSGPLTLSLGASHSWTEFAEKTGNEEHTGANLATTVGVNAVFNRPGYPIISAGVGWNDVINRGLAGQNSTTDTLRLNVGASQLVGGLQYSVGYSALWGSGTFDENHYASHLATVQLQAPIADGATFRAYGNYYLRLPDNDAPTNPRYDNGNLGMGVLWRISARTYESVSYGYQHSLIQSSAAPTLSSETHTLASLTTHRLTPRLMLTGSLAASYDDRSGATESRSGSESAALAAYWNRPIGETVNFGLSGGGNVGAFETDSGRASLAYGVRAGTSVAWTREVMRLAFHYAGSFGSNVDANTLDTRPGWGLSQQLSLSADRRLAKSVQGRALITFVGNRREDPVLGSFASMTAALSLGVTAPRHGVLATAGISEGASSALGNPLVSDGLFLPAAYDTHSLYAAINFNQALDSGRLTLIEMARVQWTAAPGRTDATEFGFIVTATYRLGQFLIIVDDRLSLGGTGGTSQVGNLFMARLSRAFSWGM